MKTLPYLLLIFCQSLWADSLRFTSVDTEQFYRKGSLAASEFHGINLNIVQLTQSHWTEDKIMEHFKKTARIYQQCHIKIKQVRLYKNTSHSTKLWKSLRYTEKNFNLASLAIQYQKIPKPIVFFVDEIKAARVTLWAISVPLFSYEENSQAHPSTLHTAWVARSSSLKKN